MAGVAFLSPYVPVGSCRAVALSLPPSRHRREHCSSFCGAGPRAGICAVPFLLSGVCMEQRRLSACAVCPRLGGNSRAFLVRWPRRDLSGLRVSGLITVVVVVRQDLGGSVVGGLVHYWPASVHRTRPSFLTQVKSLAWLGLGASPSSGMAASVLRPPDPSTPSRSDVIILNPDCTGDRYGLDLTQRLCRG